MRNLWVRGVVRTPVAGGEGVGCWCQDGGATVLVRGGEVLRVEEGEGGVTLLADLVAEGAMEAGDSVAGLALLPDLPAVLVATAGGALVQVATSGLLEEVGEVAAGIAAMALAPDLELLVLVTRDLKVVTMTREGEVVREEALEGGVEGEGRQVSLGWGRKETQFHGSEGKAAREVGEEAGRLVAGDDRRVRVSWRGDGQMVAVSYVAGEVGEERREVRVFTREGALYSTSQAVPGLEQSLAWRPSGAQIAVTVTRPNMQVGEWPGGLGCNISSRV